MVIDNVAEFISKLPPYFNLMALDMGEKKIGAALWCSKVATSVPLKTLIRKNLRSDLKAVINLATEYEITAFIIGLPLDLNASETPYCQKIRYFAKELSDTSNKNITFISERHSTAIADDLLKHMGMNRKQRAQHDDALAAYIILEDFRERFVSAP
jgi:putative Holliday junction resolvase